MVYIKYQQKQIKGGWLNDGQQALYIWIFLSAEEAGDKGADLGILARLTEDQAGGHWPSGMSPRAAENHVASEHLWVVMLTVNSGMLDKEQSKIRPWNQNSWRAVSR